MRYPRRSLLVLCATILLTTAGLNPSAKMVYSAQFAFFQQEAANESHSPQFEESKSSFDREHFEDISQVLSMIETGQTTLHLIDKYEIGVGFELGEGSRFYPYRNEIIIDSKFGHYSAAILLIHEVTHARYFHEGLAADVALNAQHVYVQRKMEEEVNAMVASIEATSELWEAGIDISNLHPSLYYPYKQAYGSAFRAAKHDYPGLGDKTLQNIGRAAGKHTVSEGVLGGQVVTSITQQTYLEYWGLVWDEKRDL